VTSHLGLMILFAAFVSAAFAVLSRDEVPDQLRFGARIFCTFIGAAYLLGWLLYPLPL
jgi:hypothetical protein